jgi:hypothetical protein
MAWQAQIRGADHVAPELLSTFQEGVQSGLEKISVQGEKMVKDNISTAYDDKPPAVAFGNLLGSVASSFFRGAEQMGLIIGVSPTLGADKYAAPVETGARPHFPPYMLLVPWVMKKFGVEGKEAVSTAFLVARSIAKKGTAGHQMFSRALVELDPVAGPILEAELGQAFLRAGYRGVFA